MGVTEKCGVFIAPSWGGGRALGWEWGDKLPAWSQRDLLLLPARCSTCRGSVPWSPTGLNSHLPDPPGTQSPIIWLQYGPGPLFPGFLVYPASHILWVCPSSPVSHLPQEPGVKFIRSSKLPLAQGSPATGTLHSLPLCIPQPQVLSHPTVSTPSGVPIPSAPHRPSISRSHSPNLLLRLTPNCSSHSQPMRCPSAQTAPHPCFRPCRFAEEGS